MIKILFVFGTRPEAIKLAPVIKLFMRNKSFDTKVCVTAQHRYMLDQVLSLFDIVPDFDLNLMKSNQDLTDITSDVILGMRNVFKLWRPDWVLVHGDTTTTFAASLSAYYEKIFIGHIEAGLRTKNIYSPWPEEANRKIVATIANLNFAPTELAKKNLIDEGVSEENILVVGNAVIDSLLTIVKKIEDSIALKNSLADQFSYIDSNKKIILVTTHRRENFGQGFIEICKALTEISSRNDVQIIYPLHLNPNVQEPARRLLEGNNNIKIIDPLDYLPFVYIMMASYMILTDSGGIQEEAPSLGKPVLVLREKTERPEAVHAGTVLLVGANKKKIIAAVDKLIDDKEFYLRMSSTHNPYGNGDASIKILEYLKLYMKCS